MSARSSHGGFETFAESASDDLAMLYDLAQPISDKIADTDPRGNAYQSMAIFALDPSNSDIASALTTVESLYTDLEDREHRADYIDYRRVLLANTALGDFIRPGNFEPPHFAQSKLNPLKQFVYTERIFDPHSDTKRVIGAAQYGFSLARIDRFPTNEQMERINGEAAQRFKDMGAVIASLQERAPNLSRALEILPSGIPNAIVIRWDVQDSTSIETGRGAGTYNAYLDFLKGELYTLIESINSGESKEPYKYIRGINILERGDGQNITIPLPRDARYTDPRHPESYKARMFANNDVEPFFDAILAIQHEAARRYYYGAGPIIRNGVGVGYVEPAPYGDLSGPVLSEVSKLPYAGLGRLSLSYDAKKIFTGRDQ